MLLVSLFHIGLVIVLNTPVLASTYGLWPIRLPELISFHLLQEISTEVKAISNVTLIKCNNTIEFFYLDNNTLSCFTKCYRLK